MKDLFSLRLISGLLALFLWSGCMSDRERQQADGELALNGTYDLSRSERAALSKEARKGSGEAAFRLHLFHAITWPNQKEALKWLKLSAELGYVPGEFNYAQRL